MKLCETYPGSFLILPALWTKFTGVSSPEIFALMKGKEVEYDQGEDRGEYGT